MINYKSLYIFFYNIAYLAGNVLVWVAVPLIPIIMDCVAPLNETRENVPMFQTDYKIDPDKYFYAIYSHGLLVTIITVVMFAAVDSMFMSLSQHACAMFEVLRLKLQTFAMFLSERLD